MPTGTKRSKSDNKELVYVHHALDGREARERAGHPVDGKCWATKGEGT